MVRVAVAVVESTAALVAAAMAEGAVEVAVACNPQWVQAEVAAAVVPVAEVAAKA